MVGGNASIQRPHLAGPPGVGVVGEKGIDAQLEFVGLLLAHQRHMGHLLHRFVAAPAAKNKIDGGQHVALLQLTHDKGQAHPAAAPPTGLPLGGALFLELGVDCLLRDVEQGHQPLAGAVVKLERHRAKVGVDQLGGAVDFLQPVGQLARIFYRGGEGQQLNLGRAIDDRLFPHGAALAVVHVVALVEHHGLHLLQGGAGFADASAVEHVAKDFGGHHHDRGVAVDGEIAGQQTYILVAKLIAKVAQLLV